jgi:hypothetical protein
MNYWSINIVAKILEYIFNLFSSTSRQRPNENNITLYCISLKPAFIKFSHIIYCNTLDMAIFTFCVLKIKRFIHEE